LKLTKKQWNLGKLKNKKGNLFDLPETVITLFGLAIVGFIVITILTHFGTTIKSNTSINESTQITTAFDKSQAKLNTAIDYGALAVVLFFTVGMFILAKFIPSDTLFMILMFIFMFVFILFSFIFANVHGGMMENVTYANYINGTTYLRYFLPKLPYISIIQLVLVSIALYTKKEQ